MDSLWPRQFRLFPPWGARFRGAFWIVAALIGLATCALLETSDDPSPSQAFITPDGETEYDINGTWRGPCLVNDAGTASYQYLLDFLNKDLVLVQLDWASDAACTGDPDTVVQYEGTFSIDGTKEVGWNPSAPYVLSDPITATTFTHKLKTAADFGDGEVDRLTYVGLAVPTADPVVIYIGAGFDSDLTIGDDGYPQDLKAEPYVKD